MKTCPNPRCGVAIDPHYFACSRHWKLVPDHDRNKIVDLFYQLHRELVSVATVRIAERDLLVRMGWHTPGENEVGGYYQRAHCAKCWAVCLNVRRLCDGKLIAVEPDNMVGDVYYLIGFSAVRAADLGFTGAYTPFVEHRCKRTTTPAVPSPTPRASATVTRSG